MAHSYTVTDKRITGFVIIHVLRLYEFTVDIDINLDDINK